MAEYRKTMTLANEDAAYLAGLIDGEGTITLTRRQKEAERSIVITIANTERILVEHPLILTGVGRISSKRIFKEGHSPSWVYQVSGRQALEVIRQIAPFLKSYKRNRAELALQEYIRLTPRNGRYSTELLEERNRFVDTFFAINSNEKSSQKRAVSK